MGLSISAYSNVKKVEATFNEEDELVDSDGNIISDSGLIYIRVIPAFAERALEFADNEFYSYEESTYFSAGSYSGYGEWRRWLAEFAGYQKSSLAPSPIHAAWMSDEGPFWELLSFSDCEGTIGTKVSQKLLNDFKQFSNKLSQDPNQFHVQTYKDLQEVFELASNNGFVKFS